MFLESIREGEHYVLDGKYTAVFGVVSEKELPEPFEKEDEGLTLKWDGKTLRITTDRETKISYNELQKGFDSFAASIDSLDDYIVAGRKIRGFKKMERSGYVIIAP